MFGETQTPILPHPRRSVQRRAPKADSHQSNSSQYAEWINHLLREREEVFLPLPVSCRRS